MKRIKVVTVFALLVLAFTWSMAAGINRGVQLNTSLEVLPWYTPSEPITMRFTMENTAGESFWVLKWQLPSDDMDSNLFEVTCNGKPVQYIGPLVKRAAPTSEDYVQIGAGETFTVDFDPSAVYDMSAQGQYTIRYRLQGLYSRKDTPGAQREAFPSGRAVINAARPSGFWFEGIQQPPSQPAVPEESLMGIGGYTKCTTSQQSTLQTAHNNAITISGKAKSQLAANPNGSTLYTYWFGAFSTTNYNTVKAHYNSINSAFTSQSVKYNCSCKQNYYAYVYPNQPYTIYVCKAFWSAPALGRDSKAGTLVHEMSHFYVTASTDDYVYGATGAHNLALTNPAQAIDNADNHEYFAEDQP